MHASEAGHWYDSSGAPKYTVTGKNGKERNTTLRDAREFGYVPSVTGIINCAAKPALQMWMQKQVLLAALTLPRKPDEPETEWLERVMRDSREQGYKAAERGTRIYAAIQGHYEGVPPAEEYWPHVQGAAKAVDDWTNHLPTFGWAAETSFHNPLGFGGKVDLFGDCPREERILDFKTKEFKAEDKLDTWDEHAMQLAAYRVGLGIPDARCAIVYVSASVPGVAKLIELPAEKLAAGWEMFQGLLAYWQAKSGYYPAEKLAA